MTACQQVVAAWNAQADELNQWADLGEDEKIEWALKCADQFRDATKLMQAARQAHNIDTAILDRKENAKALIISRRCDGNSGVFARNTTGVQCSERRPLQACETLPQMRRIASSKDARAQKTGTN